ncbi:MAG: arsenate reductase (azurin) large subunit [Calditrichaeota bacterium]|nr:MAG: arsenate reductase (azurin) large subunit [Calditrichota bacterium]
MAVKLTDRVPIPPKDAEVKYVTCEFCIVGCGYKAYKWPYGKEGGKKPSENALGLDLSRPQGTYGTWASPNMVNVVEENGRKYHVMVIPDHDCEVNGGLNSVRGGLLASTLFTATGDTRDRLKEPMVYRGRKLYETSWEEATTLIAKVVKRVLDNDNPNDIAMTTFDHGGGGGGFENTWGTGKLFFKAIGTESARIHNRPAYNSEVHASREMGVGELNSSYYDSELADTLLIIGANPVECQTNLFYNHYQKNLSGESVPNKKKEFESGETARRGRIIIVDPRRTVTVKTCEKIAGKENVLHLQIKPGTDIALMNGLFTYIYEKGWHAKEFVRKHTENFEEARKANKLSLKECSRITGVPVSQLKKAAEWLAKPKPSGHRPRNWILYEKGVIWGIKNYECIASIVNLALLTQSIGRVGTGCSRGGGHQEGYARPPYPGPSRQYLPVIDEHVKRGDYKVMFIWGCDPFTTTLDAENYREAMLRRSDVVKKVLDRYEGADLDFLADKIYEATRYEEGLFVVNVDIYPKPSMEAAHVVLPAATTMEMNLTSMNGERRLRLSQKVVEPPGSAKPDCLIAADIANAIKQEYQKYGVPRASHLYTLHPTPEDATNEMVKRFSGFDWKTEEDAFNDGFRSAHLEEIDSQGGPTGHLATYERLAQAGNNGVQLPIKEYKDGKLIGTRLLYSDYKFGTPSGKARFLPTPQPPMPEQIQKMEGRHKYWVNNGRINHMWQTNYHTLRLAYTRERYPMPPVFINAKDMKELGLKDGDLIMLYNDYGSTRGIAVTSDEVRPGEVFMAFAFPNAPVGNIITDYVDPDTKIPYYKGTLASIKKIGENPSLVEKMSFKERA